MRSVFLLSFLPLCLGKIYTAPEQLSDGQYDFIVVGAGNVRQLAGSVVAARLSEVPHFRILVIEAGGLDTGTHSAVIHTPFLAGQGAGTVFDWNYTTTPQPGLNGRVLPFPRGFVVGGSSSINNLVYIRGPSEDFDRIATISGDAGWSWQSLQPYMPMNERHVLPWNNRSDAGEYDPAAHGDGPLQTSLPATQSELNRRVMKMAEELEDVAPWNPDLNSGDCLGVGQIHSTVGQGARSSAATAFLHPALESRDNIDLLLHTQVLRLIPVPGEIEFRTVEVSQGRNAPTYRFSASMEVVLSAGAIGTPQILQLSGIGPKEPLERAGVPQLVDLPVGRSLQDQLIFRLQWAADAPTLSSFLRDPAALAAAFDEYATSKTGIAAGNVPGMIAFLRVHEASPLLGDGDPAAGPHSAHFLFSFLNTFAPNAGQTPPADGDWITVGVFLQSPTSTGTVDIASSSAFDHPLIDPAYLSTPFDIGAAVEAVKTLRTLFSAPAWDGFLGGPYSDAANLTTDAGVEAYVRKFANTIKHPVGTARISAKDDEAGGVVGPDLAVRKTSGVRVVDASVWPFASAGFPQAQVYILAERAAALIKNKWSDSSRDSAATSVAHDEL